MGIQGLLPFLKKIHDPVNIAKFAGCTVAIDAYCWLHKGAFSCAEKLVLGEKTDQYVYYCMKYLEYMLKNNLKPIMVFDGCFLPSKKDVEKNRREKRQMYKKKAAQLLREGNRAEARECLQRCIDISPEMALRLMEICRERGVDCIVAPYEADAQLAYLSKSGVAQVIVTEDSDLILFGCERVIFKMDHFGNGIMIEKNRLNEVLEIQNGFYTFDKFRYMCILSGCDYLPSLSGIGLAKACKVFKLARQTDLKVLLKKFPSTYLKMSLTVDDTYIDGFIKADNTFLYQLVFDPLSRKLVPLNDYKDDIDPEDMPYAGSYMANNKALQIALGNTNIYTMEKFADFDPDTFVPGKVSKKKPESLHMLSIWNKNYRIRPKFHLTETQNRPNLKGKEVVIKTKLHRTENLPKPAEECEEVKSDLELSGLYHNSAREKHSSSETETTPPRKRRRESNSSEDEPSPVKKYRKFTKSPRKPEFFSSLVEADTEKNKSTCDSPKSNEEKENELISPHRNKFAVVTPTKKPKFNLNAPKEVVKSRFFASTSLSSIKSEPTEINDKNQEFTEKQNDITENTDKTITKPSSKSAFNWSRFKSDNVVVSSPCSRNPFKRVVSDTNLTASQKSISRTLSQQSFLRSESQNSLDNLSQVSSHSNLYSIDSDCLTDIQDLEDCEDDSQTESNTGLVTSQTTENKLISDISEDKDEEDIVIIKTEPGTSSQDLISAGKTIKKAPIKPGCRVSGLSCGKKKSPAVDIKQQSLKDLFSKFSNNKNKTLPRLKHEKTEDLSATPVTDNSALTIKGTVHRCLMP